jgi:hypothetical protein
VEKLDRKGKGVRRDRLTPWDSWLLGQDLNRDLWVQADDIENRPLVRASSFIF